MAYIEGVSKYAGLEKPAGNVALVQTVFTPGYGSPKAIAWDKEIKGGLHRVDYLSQLLVDDLYDGIFMDRRELNMGCVVRMNDDGSPNNGLYIMTTYPGTESLDDWDRIGTGASLTINNPRTVPHLVSRDAITYANRAGTIVSGAWDSVTNTTEVVGTGTNFNLVSPDGYIFPDGYSVYKVASIVDATHLRVEGEFETGGAATWREVLVKPNEFVNVGDARTADEKDTLIAGFTGSLEAGEAVATFSGIVPIAVGETIRFAGVNESFKVIDKPTTSSATLSPEPQVNVTNAAISKRVKEPYGLSFIWDGQQWITVYAYGNDPRSHSKNNDTQLMTANGAALTGTAIDNHIKDTAIHFKMADSDVTYDEITGLFSAGVDGRVISSKKVMDILSKFIRKDVEPATNPRHYLAKDGNYYEMTGGNGGGPITSIDGGSPSSFKPVVE